MSWKCFDVTVADHVAHVVLNRPDELNSMIREFWNELPLIVRELDDRGDVRVIVVSSTGRHFCAGMDLAVFSSADSGLGGGAGEMGRIRARLRQTALMLQESFSAFEKARMPVIAAIQGGCIGGAVDMVTAADMRYCSADAFFVIQEINIGMTADVGTLQRLPKLIPDGVAREMAYTGRRMTARRALEVGLVNEVFDTHEELVPDLGRLVAIADPHGVGLFLPPVQTGLVAIHIDGEVVDIADEHLAGGQRALATTGQPEQRRAVIVDGAALEHGQFGADAR